MRRLGMLTLGAPGVGAYEVVLDALPKELAKLGWVEGRNLRVDRRDSSLDPKRLRALADELVSLHPDVIFTFTGIATQAAKERTQSVPIVFVGGGDPAENGLVGGVARPSGNATGFANNFGSMGGKQLELLKRAVPSLTRVAHVFDPEVAFGAASPIQRGITAAAAPLAITIVSTPVRNPDESARALDTFAATPDGGLLMTGALPSDNLKAILQSAQRHRLPAMWGPRSSSPTACS